MKTIQSKILFVVITALIVITVIVSAISVTITHEIIHRDADRILNNVSQKEVAQINDMLNDFIQSSAIMEHYMTYELEDADALRDEAYRAAYVEVIRHMFDVVALQTAGTTSYYLCLSPDLAEETAGFYIQFDPNGNAYELSETEFSGLSIITPEELVEYSNHKGDKTTSWVQPHPSRFTGETVISYITLIYSGNTFVGILGFNMNFDYLIDRIGNISVYDSGHALLLSEDGDTCYNPSEDEQFADEYTHAAYPLVNGMRLELRAAYKDIQSNIRPMLTYIVLAFVVVLTLAILYTFWVTHRIVKPLKKLTAEARKVSTGDKDINLVVNSNDEVGILSHVLDESYAKIREYSTYINALAYRDSLTGIKNSTAYSEAVQELNRAINLSTPAFGVIVADINNLKQTNDTYGHDAGNELIVHAAKILTATFKTSSIFRIGGDEFAVLLKGKDLEQYRALIEQADAAFAAAFISVTDKTIPVSIARGVAIFDPTIDHVYTDVFAKADHAMYMHKESIKLVRR